MIRFFKYIISIIIEIKDRKVKKQDSYYYKMYEENLALAKMYEKEYRDDVLNERVDNTKWVILRYPNDSMAQLAGMNTEEFEDFYFKVCNLDYGKKQEKLQLLVLS